VRGQRMSEIDDGLRIIIQDFIGAVVKTPTTWQQLADDLGVVSLAQIDPAEEPSRVRQHPESNLQTGALVGETLRDSEAQR
jgi:hypothetical protein